MAIPNSEPRGASLQARVVRSVTSIWFSLIDAETANINVARLRMNAVGKLLPTAGGVRVRPVEIAGLDAEWLEPDAAPPHRVILYLHGGAYVLGGCDSHRHLVSHIARESGVRALLPEYSLAPENPHPAAVEDVVEVYRALLGDGYAAADIVVAGDSAGGGLSAACLLAFRDAGLPMPAGLFLISPWLDLSASGESMQTRDGRDPWFRPGDIAVVAGHYCRREEVREPKVSPVFADVRGFPPTFIQVGDDELLLSDATRFADKLRAAGGQVNLEVYPGMWHVFQAFLLVVPEARDAVRTLAAHLREVLRGPSVAGPS